MKRANDSELFYAGIDFRGAIPQVCFQNASMKEAQPLFLDFDGCGGRTAYFRKILSALRRYGRKEELRAVVVLKELSEESVRRYLQDICEAGFIREQVRIVGEAESVAHLIMHQSNDVWQQQAWLLELSEEEVRALGFHVNKRASPMLVQALEPECGQIGSLEEGSRDERLFEFLQGLFEKEKVSAVFVTGTDFAVKDYKRSREFLCFRRRVFLAEQIHARGACALAGDTEEKMPYLFLNEQTLLYNVGIRSVRAGEESLHMIVRAGCNWYDAHGACELMLMEEPLLEFVFRPMMGGEPIWEGMPLPELPARPQGASRLLVEARFLGPTQCEVTVTDLGLGELYPASDLCWRESFALEAPKEEADGPGQDL